MIHDLIDSDLIRFESTHSNTQYLATAAGKETLKYFQDKISESIQEDVLAYFSNKKMELKNENSILADFYKPRTRDMLSAARSGNAELLFSTLP